jgi:hypothetical protein
MDNTAIDTTFATTIDQAKIPVISLNESASGLTYEGDPNFFGDGTTVLGILWGQLAMPAAAGAKVFGGRCCVGRSRSAVQPGLEGFAGHITSASSSKAAAKVRPGRASTPSS